MDKILKNEMELIELRMELRQLAKEFYVVYKAFVDAGFNEEQALVLAINLTGEEA